MSYAETVNRLSAAIEHKRGDGGGLCLACAKAFGPHSAGGPRWNCPSCGSQLVSLAQARYELDLARRWL